MANFDDDTIGFGPSDPYLPVGALELDMPVTGYVGGSDFKDSWAIELPADRWYRAEATVISPKDSVGHYDLLTLNVDIADPLSILGTRQVRGIQTSGFTDPVVDWTFPTTETNTYYIDVGDDLGTILNRPQYRLTITDVTPVDEPEPLPELVPPAATSLEAVLYTGRRDDDGVIEYLFDDGRLADSVAWSAPEKAAVRSAMARYAEVSNLTFTEITSRSEERDWTLVLDPTLTNLGEMNLPGGDSAQEARFGTAHEGWTHTGGGTGLSPGGDGYLTLLHEFGHGLGLDHPHDAEGSLFLDGVSAPDDRGVHQLNQSPYTVMTYNDITALNGPMPPETVNWGRMAGPGPVDIAVIQRLYGARDAREGDDIYTLPRRNAEGTGFQTIWDTDGTDRIVTQARSTDPVHIDLRPATLEVEPGGGGWLSWREGIAGGFVIANGVVIEEARGGAGRDMLIGNGADNVLMGRDAGDTLRGNGGHDLLDGGKQGDALIGNAGRDTLKGGLGNDTLTGGPGRDTLKGGGGIDEADFSGAKKPMLVDLISGLAVGDGWDRIFSVEQVVGSRFDDSILARKDGSTLKGGGGDDTLLGDDKPDRLEGGPDHDFLFGWKSRDTLKGGAGADTLVGGPGRDTLKGGPGPDVFLYHGAQDTGRNIAGFDRIADFEAGDTIDLTLAMPATVRIFRRDGDSFVVGDVDGDGKRDFGIAVLDSRVEESDLTF